MITVGIDNGTSGSIGVIGYLGGGIGSGPRQVDFCKVPTQEYLHYGQRGTISLRLDRAALTLILAPVVCSGTRVFIERPFSGQFINAVVPAHRTFEATIIVMEDLGLGYTVIDSREWQKPVLGAVSGSAELKKASKLRGIQLYPQHRDAITKHKDADGLLIAHHFHYYSPPHANSQS